MNTEHRNKVLIGFGALAVVLIAAIALWPPSFRSEEASGAIGAVQKHHAPQIAQKDVILGDEATRREQKVLWSDFLNDASKMQTLSAQMVANAQTANIANNIDKLNSELEHQFSEELAAELSEIQMEANKAGNKRLAEQAVELAGKVSSAQQMSGSQMQQYAQMFESIEESANKTAQKGSLVLADQDLVSALNNLKDTDLAASKIHAAEEQLQSFDLNAVSMANRDGYFSEIAAASAALSQAEVESAKMGGKIMYAAEVLSKTASKIEDAALNNIEDQAAANIEIAHALNHMESVIAANKGAGDVALVNDITALSHMIESKADVFRSEASANFSMQIAEMGNFSANQEQSAKLTGSAAAGSKVVYSLLMNEAPLQNALVKLDAALHNGDMANLLSNDESLMASVGKLQSELESKGH